MNNYDEITAKWNELVEILRFKDTPPDLDAIKHLIFDTYHFLKSDIKEDSIPRKKLELYRYICQVCESLSEDYPLEMPASVSETCEAFVMGLCFIIENGFDCGYLPNSLPSGPNRHTPAGCAAPEDNMTTFEIFEKAFNNDIEYLREEYDEE